VKAIQREARQGVLRLVQTIEQAVCTQQAKVASSIANTNGLDASEERRSGTKQTTSDPYEILYFRSGRGMTA
jgi:hypothetical protein